MQPVGHKTSVTSNDQEYTLGTVYSIHCYLITLCTQFSDIIILIMYVDYCLDFLPIDYFHNAYPNISKLHV